MAKIRQHKLFFLFLFSSLFLAGVFFIFNTVVAQPDLGLQPVQESLGLPDTDIRLVVARIIRIFLSVLGVVAVVLMLYAGYLWMTAGGNDEKITQSKRILINATIGLAIILSAYAIVNFVMSRLLSATTGYPSHCFDGVQNEGESSRDCGGDCAACGGGECLTPPCGFSNVFFVESLPNGGNVCVRNIKPAIIFSEAVDISTLNTDTVIVKKSVDDSIVRGVWQWGDNRNVALFIPDGSCQPDDAGNDCLEASTQYILDINNNATNEIKNADGNRTLNCSLHAKCDPVEFITGNGVDRNPPTVALHVINPFPSGSIMPAEIDFTDDNGLQNIGLYANRYFVASQGLANCQRNGRVVINWSTVGLLGEYQMRGIGLDWAGNSAVDTQNVTLMPEHCFNHQQDNPGEYILSENQYELGIDCGGDDCRRCGGNSCTNDQQCASGYCEIVPPAVAGICVDKMRIDNVSPLSGAPNSFVTISGYYFGGAVGKVYFSKVNNPDTVNLNMNQWQQAELADCGVGHTWTPWQIIALVPTLNTVNSPILVETASSTGRDGVERKFFDTTNNNWGRLIDDFFITDQTRPGLCPIVPDSGNPNDSVLLQGKNFGIAGGQVFFGSQQGAVQNWAETLISVKIPYIDRGAVGVSLRRAGVDSNSVYFYVNGLTGANTPVIHSLSPNFGTRGEYITISGAKFGNNQGTVWFKKDGANPIFVGSFDFPSSCRGATWNDNQIIVKFPVESEAENGNYRLQIRTSDNRVSNLSENFRLESGVPAPGICRIDPIAGPVPFAVGGSMRIYGEYFNLINNNNVNGSVVYFWGTNAVAADIAGRILMDSFFSDSNDQLLHFASPPVGTVTGPVVAYRPEDGKLGNGFNFTVHDCVRNNNTCTQTGFHCCASAGADQGICRLNNELCSGETRLTGYVWRFSTRDIPLPLTVVERCDNDTELARALPSPSPATIWNRVGFPTDDHSDVCRTALVEIEFSRADVRQLASGELLVDKCSAASLNLADNFCISSSTVPVLDQNNLTSEFLPTPSVRYGENSGRAYLELKPRSGSWEDNTWYRVALKNTISASDGNLATTLVDTRPCDLDGVNDGRGIMAAYCFFFRTGAENCRLRAVVITPYSYWTNYLESPLRRHISLDESDNLYYSGHGLSDQRCIMMDVSGFDWNWSSSNTRYADIYSGGANITNVQVSALQNTVGINLSDPPNAVNINAQVSTGTRVYFGHSPLTIDLSDPTIVDYWPNCLETCTDAAIGVRFNLTMSASNLSHLVNGPVQLLKCFDENCISTEVVPLRSLTLDETSNYSVLRINPVDVLNARTIYQVVLSNVYNTPPSNPTTRMDVLWSAGRYNDPSSYSKPFNQRFTWRFRTKQTACQIDRVEVTPRVFNAPSLNAKNIYQAEPYSAPDNCSAIGQKLDANQLNWQWSSSNENVAIVNSFVVRGYNPFCTASCVRKGSDVPAGVVGYNLRVCGNDIIEGGEDCDPPNAGAGCGLNCLRLGNNNSTTTASGRNFDLCGDGFVSPQAGEECDPGSSVSSTRFNCTSNCLFTGSGSFTNAVDVSASICGNGYVGAGEDCDLGISPDPDVSTSSVGCAANCLHQGTRLSTKWCADNRLNFGGFTRDSYNTYCAQAYSQCGDGVVNPDEDPGCDGENGWNEGDCNIFCLKIKTGQGCVGSEGCSRGNYLGSSLLYNTPSVCGDSIASTGEDPACELNLEIINANDFTSPWVLATGIGRGTPSGDPLAQRANITGVTRTNTAGGLPKSGSGEFVLRCGYRTDVECADHGGYGEGYGVALNSCCYPRPRLDEVYPGITTTQSFGITPSVTADVCPNTYISAHFDSLIDARSLTGNLIIARGISGTNCAEGEQNVSKLVLAIQANNANNNFSLVDRYKIWWHKIVYFWQNLFGQNAQARPRSMNVRTWCAGQDIGTAEVVADSLGGGSKIKVNLQKPLALNTDYAIILKSAIQDERGVRIAAADSHLFWRFSTANAVCELNNITVNPEQIYFSYANATTTLEAIAHNTSGALIQPIIDFYAWDIIWGPQVNNFVSFSSTSSSLNTITAKNQNGEIDVRAAALITANKYTAQTGLVATGRAHVIVFLCENPWPPKDLFINGKHEIIFPYEDRIRNNDDFSIIDNIFTGRSTPASTAVNPGYFNFSTYYCADNGNVGVLDDLPYLRPAVQAANSLVSVTSSLKRFLFTNHKNSDAIGVRIFPNVDHLTVRQWFLNSEEFGGQGFAGNLQSLKIDGYDAVSDGNNIYVDALDFVPIIGGPHVGDLYTNIYLFSINADAQAETKNVFEQIIKNLKFNTNLTNYGYCGSDLYNPDSLVPCNTDFECANGEICATQIDKLKRNYQRIRDLSSIEKTLNSFYVQNQSYPNLNSGTYLSGQTLSTWPSWSLLGNALGSALATDPINRLGQAGSCSSSTGRYCRLDADCPASEKCVMHDSITGWSTVDRRFSFACNETSLAYRYLFSSSTGDYIVRGKMENAGLTIRNWSDLLRKFFIEPRNITTDGICLPGETISTMQAGVCGDGQLNLNLGEQCDPPGYRLYADECNANVRNLQICNNDCRGWTNSSTPCSAFSTCGNGQVEAGEICDDGVLNGRYNHCDTNCLGRGAMGWCGDGVLQAQFEMCETVDNKCTFAGVSVAPLSSPIPIYYFLIDLSGSMNNEFDDNTLPESGEKSRLQYIQEQLPLVAQSLSGKAKIGITTFSDRASIQERMSLGFCNRADVGTIVNAFRAGGSTYTGPAIKWVSDNVFRNFSVEDRQRPTNLVLLTDGDETAVLQNERALTQIQLLAQQGIKTYVIGVAYQSVNFTAWALAGGTNPYISIDSSSESLSHTIAGILTEQGCRSYFADNNRSCKFDCSGFGGFCGDGNVDDYAGEECESDQACIVDGVAGTRKCNRCLHQDGLAKLLWDFEDYSSVGCYGTNKRVADKQGTGKLLFCDFANGISSCPVSPMSGHQDNAMFFNGSNHWFHSDIGSLIDLKNFSVSVWINPTSTNKVNLGIVEKISRGTGFSLRFRPVRQDSAIADSIYLSFNGEMSKMTSTLSLRLGQWNHVLFTYHNNVGKLYINGQLDQTKNNLIISNNTAEINVGRARLTSSDSYFHGLMDDLAFYARALTEAEIADLYQNNWLCVPSVSPLVETITSSPAICGDGRIDELNVAGIREECDNGATNGIVCANGYNHSCSYCAADCSAVIFREATGYCGDGIINESSAEVCDVDSNTGVIYAVSSSSGVVDSVKDEAHNGYQVRLCDDEFNTKLNASSSYWATLPNWSEYLLTRKKGTKACINDCRNLQNNCVECGLSASGVEMGGYMINVLEPTSTNPLYIEPNKRGMLDLYFVKYWDNHRLAEADESIKQKLRVAYHYSTDSSDWRQYQLKPANFNVANNRLVAFINANPLCSSDSMNILDTANDPERYQLVINDDRLEYHRQNMIITSEPTVGQYDLVLSPTMASNPSHLRIVVSWSGTQDLVSGFFAPFVANPMWEGASVGATIGRNYYMINQSPWRGIWWHQAATLPSLTNAEAFTVNIDQMATSTYAFYVRSPDLPLRNFVGTGRVKVEVYLGGSGASGDVNRHFDSATPGLIFTLDDAIPSDNPAASYWHVFNIKKSDAVVSRIERVNRMRTAELRFSY